MNNNKFIDTTSTVEVDAEEYTAEDILNELESVCEFEDDDFYGMSSELLIHLLDVCNEWGLGFISEDDSFGDCGIHVELDILPFLEEYPNTTLYGVLCDDRQRISLSGAHYDGEITTSVLIDFYTAFRFSENITIGDDYLDAYF